MSNSTFSVGEATETKQQMSKTERQKQNLWQIEVTPKPGNPDRFATEILDNAKYLGLPPSLNLSAVRGFLVEGALNQEQIAAIVQGLLVDSVVEVSQVALVGDKKFEDTPEGLPNIIHVLPLPGVTDPEAESAHVAMGEMGFEVNAVRTFRKYWVSDVDKAELEKLASKLLCNDSIETTVHGPLLLDGISLGQPYVFELNHWPILNLEGPALAELSKKHQLSLSQIEMETIQKHFRELDREPTDAELETIAQTWSEHCSHKTLAGRVLYKDENGERQFENMLKETIFSATMEIRKDLGEKDWCVSVFKDNAGIVRFDEDNNVAFKVETHNRPSALEPYGGANTGIGGVIRDTLGTGLGAKPVCSTDVFCFAPPETPNQELPPGVMHPRMIMKGVVAGVRDYGNRMGIPTVNGAVYFDQRYVGNPLVFCGNVGLIPKDKSEKEPQPNDLIVSIGGKTGRDGIHGATFSSAELTEDSDITSGGAVQIGNAITEKMLMDVLLEARDRNLFNAVTDCGAGGYSSAVGEMGEEIGAEVWLEKVPLKYQGLSYTEIWISEAQERMVFAIPETKWEEFNQLCASESVEATIIGQYKPTSQLVLKYNNETVCDISMSLLHDGRPPVIRQATYTPRAVEPIEKDTTSQAKDEWTTELKSILGSLNVASKHWIIRQYDHEVQGGSVLKPLVGIQNDGPGDAAVVRPVLNSMRGISISCGMNPYFGDHDTYHMAASSIDEAIRNCVAVGADPTRIAILDNFCWGHTDRPETLGSLVRAALACYDVATVLQTPFISGKDSLHNEFSYTDANGKRETISIPSTLLISALGQVNDVRKCVTMDFKATGNLIYQIGKTRDELGGSHWCVLNDIESGNVPVVDVDYAKLTFVRVHEAIESGLIRSAHDMSEGGLATCVAEMAFSGNIGAEIDLAGIKLHANGNADPTLVRLFAESNTRFLVEVTPENQQTFEEQMDGIEISLIGKTIEPQKLSIVDGSREVIESDLASLKQAWQSPLDWN